MSLFKYILSDSLALNLTVIRCLIIILAPLKFPVKFDNYHVKKVSFIQYNLSSPNLVYSEIRFNPIKSFDTYEFHYLLHTKLS